MNEHGNYFVCLQQEPKSRRDYVGFNFWLAVSATCLRRLISPVTTERERDVCPVLFTILPCRLSRKTWALFAHNCPTITQLFSSLSHFFVPPLLATVRRRLIRPLFPPFVSDLSIFRVSFPPARHTYREEGGRSILRIRTENRSRSGGMEKGERGASPFCMGPAGPKLLRYKVDYAGVAILTRKWLGLLGDVSWNNVFLCYLYLDN